MKNLTYVYIVGLLFLLSGFTSVFSQYKWSKEQKMQLKEADFYFKITNYLGALKIYKELYEIDNTQPEINHKIGVCMFNSGSDKLETIPYFKNAVENGYVESFYYLARCYHLQMKFDEAISALLNVNPKARKKSATPKQKKIRKSS